MRTHATSTTARHPQLSLTDYLWVSFLQTADVSTSVDFRALSRAAQALAVPEGTPNAKGVEVHGPITQVSFPSFVLGTLGHILATLTHSCLARGPGRGS